jgi:two-component system, NtrC family, sensor kinase
VRQILLNLALNGAKAAPAEGSLWIRVAPAYGALHIRVTNLGPAIPESQLRRLFEPFTTDGPPGQGLGLWVIDQTVRQLGGRIQVVSTPEQTSFDVCLPLGVPV